MNGPSRRVFLASGFCLCAPAASALDWLPFRRGGIRAPDSDLVTHRRETVNFKRQIVEGPRRAALGVTFVGCDAQCPASDVFFSQLDQRADPEIDIYTLTLAPLQDDWRRMAQRAEEMGASKRWNWLTGEPRHVFAVIDALGADRADLASHGQIVARLGRGRFELLDSLPDDVQAVLAALT